MSQVGVSTKCKKRKVSNTNESIFITDSRVTADPNNNTFIYDFDKTDVSSRVWTALSYLKENNKFFFPNVGDSGYAALVQDSTVSRHLEDEDFHDFFEKAMEDNNGFPRNKDDSMETIAKCSWMVILQEE